ncbi:hypothetical protein [Psychroserpens burtonensis]|uniref:hypothetical protein n=1 Tax=Psychroserpens burtonensis TaxID=49278 RepID=UPI000490F261|nr:hypothetical protein [Psychroserpens burtonensis]
MTLTQSLKFLTLFSFFVLNISLGFSQTLEGTVLDSIGKPLNAKILFIASNQNDIVSEYCLALNGKFSYKLKKNYNNGLILRVTAAGYSDFETIITSTNKEETLVYNITLINEKIELLDEVIVKSKTKPFLIKKDTTVFRVDAYKDGTERKVEDLLKNIPGIEVNETTGAIKYRGKLIETVTLEGDNLFEYNYTIGTKNINIDLVDEIEAIENYSENKLLKGIENSDKVALNLKLKKNITDLTGSMDLGLGDKPDAKDTPINTSVNLLAINSSLKSFAVGSYNTIGNNLSPFNYYGNEVSIEQIREDNLYAQRVIPELSLPRVTNNNLSNINHQFFGNFNGIFDLNKKLKARVNLFYVNDRINSNQFSKSDIEIVDERFTIFDAAIFTKSPVQYRGDLELKLNSSKSSLLEYNISFRDEIIKTDRTISSNQANNFSSFLDSENVFINQNLEFTKRLSPEKALQFNLNYVTNDLGQNFNIEPSVFNNPEFDDDVQNTDSKKHNLTFKTLLLGKHKNSNYSLIFGGTHNTENFSSALLSQNNFQTVANGSNLNNLEYTFNDIFTQGSYTRRLGKFIISPEYTFRILNQSLQLLQDNTSLKSSDFIFEPSLRLIYKIDQSSDINFTSRIYQGTNSIQNFYTNGILLDNRILRNNIPDLRLNKSQNYSLTYQKNDLFNQLELSLGTNYVKQRDAFFTNTEIDELSTTITDFFLRERNENLNFFFDATKLLPWIDTTIKVTSNYSIANFKNILNNSELRDIKSNFFINSIFFKTAFNSPINFQNKTTHSYQENRSENLFINQSIENEFKLVFKPNKELVVSLNYNYIVPNLDTYSNNFSFLESTISYKPKDKNWQMNINGVNLLNEKVFEQINTTDNSTNIQRVDLLNRYILLNFSYSF